MYACENADSIWVFWGFVSGVHVSDATSMLLILTVLYCVVVVVQASSYMARLLFSCSTSNLVWCCRVWAFGLEDRLGAACSPDVGGL